MLGRKCVNVNLASLSPTMVLPAFLSCCLLPLPYLPKKRVFPAENVLMIIDAWATSNKKWGMQVGVVACAGV